MYMGKIKIDNPNRDPGFVTGAFSDGILMDGLLFISGQASVDFKTSQFVLGTIEEETQRTLENIRAIAEAAGASLEEVVKCTVYLKDINDFDKFNKVYAQYFPGIKPARTTVQAGLGKGIRIEIDCIVKLMS